MSIHQQIELDIARAPIDSSLIELLKRNSDVPWGEDTVIQWSGLPTSRIYTASNDGNLVGAVLWQVVATSAEIANIVVEKKYRRQGVATLLLQASIAAFREEGVRHLSLEVRDSNKKAQKLYRNLGFKQAATRKNYYQATGYLDAENACIFLLDI